MYTTVESNIYVYMFKKSSTYINTLITANQDTQNISNTSYFCSIALTSYVINWDLTMRRTGTFNYIDIITLKQTLIDQCNGKLRISQSVTLVFMIK